MQRRLMFGLFLLFAATPVVCAAQSLSAAGSVAQRMAEGERLTPDRSFYRGGYASTENSLPYAVHLYDYRAGDELSDGEWIPWALRSVEDGRRLQWADGQRCPAVYGVQQALADLASPRFR